MVSCCHKPKDSGGFPSAGVLQEETAFSCSRISRALPGDIGNPAAGLLLVYRNSSGVRNEILLGNQSHEISPQTDGERSEENEKRESGWRWRGGGRTTNSSNEKVGKREKGLADIRV